MRKTTWFRSVDQWICMVALNRLTGHYSGFFSVYTLPPNQAIPLRRQLRLNEENHLVPICGSVDLYGGPEPPDGTLLRLFLRLHAASQPGHPVEETAQAE